MTTNELKDYIAREDAALTRLYAEHSGIRPSWVSTEIAILSDRLSRLRADLAEAEG